MRGFWGELPPLFRLTPESSALKAPCRETMPRPRKRLAGAAEPDEKRPVGKRTKTKSPGEASPEVGNSSSQETSASKHCGKNLRSYWLMKSEPESRLEKGVDVKFSIEDLKAQPKQTACWDGVRNYQIVKEAYPDHTQFEKNNPHYDPSSKEDNPKWSMVDVQLVRMMKRFIPLAELKAYHQAHKTTSGPLKNMVLFTRQRLSVQPLTQEEFDFILSLEEEENRVN
ncbi:thymocyte nuclear protein 1 isoform X4 [Manis pentadactyla]|uniref:thymocyte nuclear protein 1 isoform X4 n=1 Tax=Manis pentadactyla TaxID=143292 RepID=UPI00255CD90F|nr:thymocyte nuclear protein 1 isoform X4 [Manis pentadactyla]